MYSLYSYVSDDELNFTKPRIFWSKLCLLWFVGGFVVQRAVQQAKLHSKSTAGQSNVHLAETLLVRSVVYGTQHSIQQDGEKIRNKSTVSWTWTTRCKSSSKWSNLLEFPFISGCTGTVSVVRQRSNYKNVYCYFHSVLSVKSLKTTSSKHQKNFFWSLLTTYIKPIVKLNLLSRPVTEAFAFQFLHKSC